MNPEQLRKLRLDPEVKRRPVTHTWLIYGLVLAALAVALFYAWPRARDQFRVNGTPAAPARPAPDSPNAPSTPTADPAPLAPAGPTPPADTPRLVVSGYIINRERIEVSPRFQGVVRWIEVKKGDRVRRDEIVVRLDDAEWQARVAEAEAAVAAARIDIERAQVEWARVRQLHAAGAASTESLDQARLTLDAARAAHARAESALATARVFLDWTVIRSPIDGVVLEKLAETGELVTPQSFGGTRGPSTALLAVADPNDLQVELDIGESDLAKIQLGQSCRVSPEAYPDRLYQGVVAEISPEANRQKGTLQVKIQILQPDRFLVPELSAKVEFP